MLKGQFTLEDLLTQLRTIQKMGPLREVFSKMPMFGSMADKVEESELAKVESMIHSMTRQERNAPDVINKSRANRISGGSGRKPKEVLELLDRFKQMREMMGSLGKPGGLLSRIPGMDSMMGAGTGGAMDPSAFERLSQRLLREAGFTKVEVRGKTGDGGIDGLGVLRVNLVSFQVYFQCKRWKGGVGAKEIRDFRGALQGRADKGLFITTGHYTPAASDEATRDGAIAIDLIDGDRLCELLKENGLGVATEMVERVRIDGSWFDGV